MPGSNWVRLTDEQMSGEALRAVRRRRAVGRLHGQQDAARARPEDAGRVRGRDLGRSVRVHGRREHRHVLPRATSSSTSSPAHSTLTDARTGETRTFDQGEHVLLPKGWQGSWANPGFYREVAVCSRDWLRPYTRTFQDGIVDPERRTEFLAIEPRGASPRRSARATGTGSTECPRPRQRPPRPSGHGRRRRLARQLP